MPSIIKFAHTLFILSCPLTLSSFVYGTDSQLSHKKGDQLTSQTLTLSSPKTGDIYSQSLNTAEHPAINTHRQYISYVSKATNKERPAPAITQTSQSDQYWKVVTGSQLNKGISFSVSQTNSIIRIAPRHDTLKSLNISDTISPHDIIITPKNQAAIKQALTQRPIALIQSKVDADALATAGLNDNSSALTLSNDAKPGEYQLQVTKQLPSEGRYLINVKEKGSPFQLTLSAPIAINQKTKTIDFNLTLSQSNKQLTPKVFLQNNQGLQTPLNISLHQDHWQAHLPDNLALSHHNRGLSEILVNLETQVDGLPVIRSVKTAFKAYVNSAKITNEITIVRKNKQLHSLLLNLDVANEGRYEVSAVLLGTNKQGKTEAIFTTQAASWLTPDSSQLKLMLDNALVQSSGLTAPFTLSELELKDQSQMARLSYQAQALTFK
ncbi:DUF4785 domain-containing protein [uncultured Shewanella sp.]|uniref:DUF4785 domain-containing protein n=1 Tax=uncultured Shewanella sp. TaxID=173975 RepID=UPI00260BCEB8|nr:DUF4785 domain-containing protein [uncultured Shewanella sp.]